MIQDNREAMLVGVLNIAWAGIAPRGDRKGASADGGWRVVEELRVGFMKVLVDIFRALEKLGALHALVLAFASLLRIPSAHLLRPWGRR